MGFGLELSDTLLLSKERGFPKELVIDRYLERQTEALHLLGNALYFMSRGNHLFPENPTALPLIEEIGGKWVFWGRGIILEQTIKPGTTEGKYKIVRLYGPQFLRQLTIEEAPQGKSYFPGKSTGYSSTR